MAYTKYIFNRNNAVTGSTFLGIYIGTGTKPSSGLKVGEVCIDLSVPSLHFAASATTWVDLLNHGNITDDSWILDGEWQHNGQLNAVNAFVSALEVLQIKILNSGGLVASDNAPGVDGTFTTVDLKTITVKDGIITNIV